MKTFVLALAAVAYLTPAATAANLGKGDPTPLRNHPNILIFLLDDVGYGHLGAFGGPIRTPNIDRVARMGLRYANHHTTALCSPSRAALLTGRNHHSVGFGVIAEIATAEPGYTGRFPKDKMPLVQAFRNQGYKTAAFGKWHNTPMDQVGSNVTHDQRPRDLGFERFYGFNGGDTSQYEPLVYDNETIIQPNVGNPDYHLTVDLADKTLEWLEQWDGERTKRPFFALFATGAAHAPHHAPPNYINRYVGEFDKGWDKTREETFARQKALGLFPAISKLTPRTAEVPAWDSLSADEKRLYARMQEIFAGFVEHTDAQFGRLLDKLEAMGELENTIIIVTSDNGASGEGGLSGSFNETLFFNNIPESLAENLARIDQLGTKYSFNHYPAGWALAGNTPFKFFKQTTHEGGVADPFILAWKGNIKDEGAIRHQYIHINDVMPTLLEVTGIPAPSTINGIAQKPLEGVSFSQTIRDPAARSQKHIQYYEMLGNRGIWQDDWKAVAFHGRLPWDSGAFSRSYEDDHWELYDMRNDPTESNDLSSIYPEKVTAMKALWTSQAEAYNVFPLDDSTSTRILATRNMFIGGRTEFEYTSKDTGLSQAISAPTIRSSHVITARVRSTREHSDGVIVASGGRFGGYALFVKDNRLHYAYNYVGLENYQITAESELPDGPLEIVVNFVINESQHGEVSLHVNGKEVATGEVLKLVPVSYGIADTFDIGSDLGTPVSDTYESPFNYLGAIDKVTFKINHKRP